MCTGSTKNSARLTSTIWTIFDEHRTGQYQTPRRRIGVQTAPLVMVQQFEMRPPPPTREGLAAANLGALLGTETQIEYNLQDVECQQNNALSPVRTKRSRSEQLRSRHRCRATKSRLKASSAPERESPPTSNRPEKSRCPQRGQNMVRRRTCHPRGTSTEFRHATGRPPRRVPSSLVAGRHLK